MSKRILVVNKYLDIGGASVAESRISKSILLVTDNDLELVFWRRSIRSAESLYVKLISGLCHAWDMIRRSKGQTMVSIKQHTPIRLKKKLRSLENDDVLHLHWLGENFLSLNDLIDLNCNIVITMHDMWYFTGGCHYTSECEGYLAGCKTCPKVSALLAKKIKINNILLAKLANKNNVTFVAVSKWLMLQAKKSNSLKNANISVIGNPINFDVFCPQDQIECRKLFGLPIDKNMVIFGAISSTTDNRKGWDLLQKALNTAKCDFDVIVFGSEKYGTSTIGNRIVHHFQMIRDEGHLSKLYSCANLMVIPSRQEAFGQTALEAAACNIPFVFFRGTGVEDICIDEKSGLPVDTLCGDELGNALDNFFIDKKSMTMMPRESVKKEFSLEVIGKKYSELFNKVNLRGQ
jgi:glycosyltransferase involved in cell wall biosynthesis